jgi:hypothetical protein
MFSKELKPGNWYDFDVKLEWAAFDTFQWYVENDLTLEYLTWSVSTLEDIGDTQRSLAKETIDIYTWWVTYKQKSKLYEKEWDHVCGDLEAKELMAKQDELEKPVGEYLHRLVDIRKFIWI